MTPGTRRALGRLVRSRYGLLGGSLVVVVLVLLVLQLVLKGAAARLGVVPRPQHYTELYFASPIPSAAPSDGHPLRLTFVIDSHEGTRRTYDWSVVARRGTTSSSLASGAVELAPSQTFRRTVGLPGSKLERATLVQVRLEDPAESIDLHLSGPVAPVRTGQAHDKLPARGPAGGGGR